MDYLHVETETLREVGREIDRGGLDTLNQEYDIRSLANRLEANWQGGSAQDFLEELREWITGMERAMDELDRLGRILVRQAEAWEESDQRWTGVYRERYAQPEPEGSLP
jgi:WXG100 family type VII secretion target